jgi:hypothetical protein
MNSVSHGEDQLSILITISFTFQKIRLERKSIWPILLRKKEKITGLIKKTILFLNLIVFFSIEIPNACGNELSGYIGLEGRYFFQDARLAEQKNHSLSCVLEPEYYQKFSDQVSLTVVPFARVDNSDEKRTHYDFRELKMQYVADKWQVTIGIEEVFWGVTEFVHLVNNINQTDLVENLDGEEKLGQPMAQLILPTEIGTFEAFMMPYFRQRTFPGRKGRPRTEIPVDTDNPEYESRCEERHVDYAFHYSHYFGRCDFGFYYFKGTSREPALIPQFNLMGKPTALTPFYPQIKETGMDLQITSGQWLFKFEVLQRDGQENRSLEKEAYAAMTGGVEYTAVRLFETPMDLGLICEYVYDERDGNATTDYSNDVVLGLRLAVNDTGTTELLFGSIYDLDSAACIFKLEGSTRLGKSCKVGLESWYFSDLSENDLLYSVRDDHNIMLQLAYYF